MKIKSKLPLYFLLIVPVFTLTACTNKNTSSNTDNSDQPAPSIVETPSYTDKLANEKIEFSKTYNMNQEYKIGYKTYEPDGVGTAEFKAKSMKVIDKAGENPADEGKKLVLVEIAVRGVPQNKGLPSTFNQIGDHPSPQFVMVDKAKNLSEVETTFFSDSYTMSKNLFELSKITMDQDTWLNTALVFQVDKTQEPDLAFRFTNTEGKTEFYDIK